MSNALPAQSPSHTYTTGGFPAPLLLPPTTPLTPLLSPAMPPTGPVVPPTLPFPLPSTSASPAPALPPEEPVDAAPSSSNKPFSSMYCTTGSGTR
ncbi:hypothetical protein KC365_g13 [Hortaea werneckii]|nr:hypothetical protein KC339_g12 [Hortaea werneckii]KAI7245930.1 hypothetical protein KC365_g13 [Hortaea werneckii]